MVSSYILVVVVLLGVLIGFIGRINPRFRAILPGRDNGKELM